MERIYRSCKRATQLGLCCLPFAVASAFTAGMLLGEGSVDPTAAGPLVLFWMLWSFAFFSPAYGLATYFVEALIVDEERIDSQGAVFRIGIAWDETFEVRWLATSHGVIDLRRGGRAKGFASFRVSLAGFSPADRLELIRAVRERTSHATQTGWDRFCVRVAVPLRDAVRGVPRALAPDERLLTRRRLDWLFGPSLILVSAAATLVSLYLGHGRAFALVALVAGLWAIVRFAYPREGLIAARPVRDPVQSRLWSALGVGTIVAFALGMIACLLERTDLIALPSWLAAILATLPILTFGVLLGLLFAMVSRSERSQREHDAIAAPAALAVWEAGERDEGKAK